MWRLIGDALKIIEDYLLIHISSWLTGIRRGCTYWTMPNYKEYIFYKMYKMGYEFQLFQVSYVDSIMVGKYMIEQ